MISPFCHQPYRINKFKHTGFLIKDGGVLQSVIHLFFLLNFINIPFLIMKIQHNLASLPIQTTIPPNYMSNTGWKNRLSILYIPLNYQQDNLPSKIKVPWATWEDLCCLSSATNHQERRGHRSPYHASGLIIASSLHSKTSPSLIATRWE